MFEGMFLLEFQTMTKKSKRNERHVEVKKPSHRREKATPVQPATAGQWEVEEMESIDSGNMIDVRSNNNGVSLQSVNLEVATVDMLLKTIRADDFVHISSTSAQAYLDMLENSWIKLAPLISIHGGQELEERLAQYAAIKTALLGKIKTVTAEPIKIQWSDLPEREKIPNFNGEFNQWANFRDIFVAEVHENNDLSKKRKLRKLLALLGGPAKRALGEYTVTDEDNYDMAWATLAQLYENKHLTVRAHLNEMNKLPTDTEDLRLVLDTVATNRRQLLSLFSAQKLYDFQLIQTYVEPRMSPETRQQWEHSRTSNDLPTWAEMTAFLDKRDTYLRSIADQDKTVKNGVPLKARIEGQGTGDRRIGCVYCKDMKHRIYRCEAFQTIPLIERRAVVKEKRLCYNCLGEGHRGWDCKRKPCPKCPKERHHAALCPQQ